MSSEKQDIYTRVTSKIIADLEQGVRTWMKPWNAEHTAGRITRPLRHKGAPYSGINVLVLWAEAVSRGFTAPIWMTFRQASEFNAHVRKGESGSLVVFADSITRTEEDESGESTEREIHYMKGYTVFNVEQIEGLPDHYYRKPETPLNPIARIVHGEEFFAATKADIRYRGDGAYCQGREVEFKVHPAPVYIPYKFHEPFQCAGGAFEHGRPTVRTVLWELQLPCAI